MVNFFVRGEQNRRLLEKRITIVKKITFKKFSYLCGLKLTLIFWQKNFNTQNYSQMTRKNTSDKYHQFSTYRCYQPSTKRDIQAFKSYHNLLTQQNKIKNTVNKLNKQ